MTPNPDIVEFFIKNSSLIIILVAIWTIPWKGFALWKSARRGEKGWFIVLLLVNSLAILEILYIFIFSKKATDQQSEL